MSLAGAAAVRQVDRAGRRWYTPQFKQEVVARCLEPGASVSKLSIEYGLNTNLVRKWIGKSLSKAAAVEQAMSPPRASAAFVPVRIERSEAVEKRDEASPPIIEVFVGNAVIVITASASVKQIEAVVRALR